MTYEEALRRFKAGLEFLKLEQHPGFTEENNQMKMYRVAIECIEKCLASDKGQDE